ncbi:MAG: hypothetical protein PVJ27_05365, partial [Candidatus Brocadiaceae bacterium]|jgi:3-hydroxyisobutyrate dehydrogenase-like beta-hydroxyacid dehydrogenase
MAAGMTRAVMLECLALGEHGGADLAAARQGVGGDAGWRAVFRAVAEAVLEGNGKHVGVKSGQLAYYLQEADQKGFPMPITRALHEFLKDAEKIVMEVNRPSPSLWHELMERAGD